MLLIACPECSRQYDATGLEPGTLVRCFCEAALTVGWPPKLAAGALTCTHCGGAVSATDDDCSYCQAAISEADRRKTTLCPACYTRIEDDSNHCKDCGLDIHPQSLAPLPADRDCPRCEGKLRVRALNGADLVECGECLGLWFTPATFKKITAKASQDASSAGLFNQQRSESTPFKKVEQVRYIPCLGCGELMNRRQYTHGDRHSHVVMDICRDHGVWLDHLEIERIMEFIQTQGGSGRGYKPLDPAPFILSKQSPPTPRPFGAPVRGYSLGDFLLWVGDLIF